MNEIIDRRTLPKKSSVIKQISETKQEQGREQILDKIKECDLEQSDIKLAIPTHRKAKQISFEEYQALIKQGKTVLEITEMTSKHLVYFYNAMLKGKINLSKEEFIQLYDQGKSLDEIAELKNINREHMTYLREFYGIKRKGATFQKRMANEKPLSQEAKDVIIGSLLGDGHITKWGYFSEKHSPAQLEYLKWKASFFKDITTDKSWDYYESIDKRSGSTIKTHSFRTTAHSFLYEMRNKFYKEIDGKWTKIIPNDIADMINEQILAIWFMDDGKTDWHYRKGIKQSDGSKPICTLCTDSFSREDMEKISKILKYKYQWDVKPSNYRNRLVFTAESSVNFTKIIMPFCVKPMLYKINEEEYIVSKTNY
jgi:transposase-like protein